MAAHKTFSHKINPMNLKLVFCPSEKSNDLLENYNLLEACVY